MRHLKPRQRGRLPAVRYWVQLLLAVAVALWVATVDAAWRTSGIEQFPPSNCNLSFPDLVQSAGDGDLIALLNQSFSDNPGPAVITAPHITLQGGWRYDGDTASAICVNGSPENVPVDSHFVRVTDPSFPDEYYSTIRWWSQEPTPQPAPALTISSTVHALTLERVKFDLSTYINLTPAAFRGGALFSDGTANSTILLSDVQVLNGRANEEGGGAYLVLRNGSTLTINDSLITGNSSGVDQNLHPRPGSGGLYIDVREGSRLVIANTVISENTAAGSAGGFKVTVRDGSSVVISNSQVLNNTAQGQSDGAKNGGGGRILIYDGSVQLIGNQFAGNHAPNGCGGGLSIEKVGSGGIASVGLDGNTFSNNTAANHPNLCLNGIDLLQSVALSGPSTVQLGQANTFTASISPASAALPITYVWEATGQPRLERIGGASDTVPYTWTTPGTKTVSVTARFAAPDGYNRQATITKTITIAVPPQSVTIQGPTSGVTGAPYTFSAVVSPAETTAPISYVWSPEPDQGQGTASATYAWSTPGSKTVSVTVQNAAGSANDSQTVEILASVVEPPKIKSYLPIIQRE